MTGAITKHRKKSDGRLTWGYWFVPGLDESGKRIQITRSGFATYALWRRRRLEHVDSMNTKRRTAESVANAASYVTISRRCGEGSAKPSLEYLADWIKDHASSQGASQRLWNGTGTSSATSCGNLGPKG